MALAYTPGLKRKSLDYVRKTRVLPIAGEVLVSVGDTVDYDTVVARTNVPGNPHIIEVGRILHIDGEDLERCMLMDVGDYVKEGEAIAETSFFGFFKKRCLSPVTGTMEDISEITSQVVVRSDSVPVEVNAYIPGVTIEVIPNNGVVVATPAAFIQGILGIGGETHGELMMVSSSEILTAEQITKDCVGKVLVGGSLVTTDALQRAVDIGVKGLVVGGIESEDLTDFLGYKMGVAITGQEDKGITLIITEGFGRMDMTKETYKLLESFSGSLACINGATQIRAGVIRPEIIIPLENIDLNYLKSIYETDILDKGIEIGMMVRVIRKPHFGALGQVSSLPPELVKIDTESSVRVMEIMLENGEKIILPRANVELIEV